MRLNHLIVIVVGVAASVATSPPPPPLIVQFDERDMRYVDAPTLPPGVKVALLEGDAAERELQFTIRLKVPPGFSLPAHTHPADERVTVLAGDVTVTILQSAQSAQSSRTFGAGAFL